ncbi:hypothetical protein BDR22DRAFT_864168 [Usnea florida]
MILSRMWYFLVFLQMIVLGLAASLPPTSLNLISTSPFRLANATSIARFPEKYIVSFLLLYFESIALDLHDLKLCDLSVRFPGTPGKYTS